jgi:hypothetical protein
VYGTNLIQLQRPPQAYIVDGAAARKILYTSHRLQPNGDKSEKAFFGTRVSLKNISCQDKTLKIGSDTVRPAGVMRDLGLWLDPCRTDVTGAARHDECRRLFQSSSSAVSDTSPCGSRCCHLWRLSRTCSRYFPACLLQFNLRWIT